MKNSYFFFLKKAFIQNKKKTKQHSVMGFTFITIVIIIKS